MSEQKIEIESEYGWDREPVYKEPSARRWKNQASILSLSSISAEFILVSI